MEVIVAKMKQQQNLAKVQVHTKVFSLGDFTQVRTARGTILDVWEGKGWPHQLLKEGIIKQYSSESV